MGSAGVSVNDVLSSISGGSLSASTEYVGKVGPGTFAQSGGTSSVSSNSGGLYLGYDSGSSGSYYLSGSGVLSAFAEYVASNDALSGVTGGSLSAFTEYVGTFSNGTFTQSGGTNNVGSNLNLGYNAGSSGSYNLSGSGALSASAEYLGDSGAGTFIQSGGSNSVGYLSSVSAPRAAISSAVARSKSTIFPAKAFSTQWETRAS